MKVQEIQTNHGTRYLLLDNQFAIIDEVFRYLKYLDVSGKSPNTIKSYTYHLKIYYDYCMISNIDPLGVFKSPNRRPIDFFGEFILWLQYPDYSKGIIHYEMESPKRSNKTVNLIMTTVLSFYQYLSLNNELEEIDVYRFQRQQLLYKPMLFELMHHNIYGKKSLLKKTEPPREIESISRSQYIELLEACTSRRDRVLMALLFEGGLRISEALGIHISDLNELESGIVKIIPRENNENGARVKNYAGGLIKLPDYVIDLILDYLCDDISDFSSDFLLLTLCGSNRGQPLKMGTVERLFERLSLKVGYKVHPHMLRHGFATEKLEAGWQMIDIKMYLRHKSITSTQIYATYSDSLKQKKMSEFLNNNSNRMRETANVLRRAEKNRNI